MDLTIEDLKKLEQGAIVSMGCRQCEGHEEHKKVDDKWICLWCGYKGE